MYHPRACDCQFCTAHGAAYLSDEKGSLSITIQNEGEISRYKQASGICDFLVCRNCGVLTNVLFQDGHDIYGSINVRSVSNHKAFSEAEKAHLVDLSDEERIQRWKRIWFPNVTIQHENV
jgi:hypothetical protein